MRFISIVFLAFSACTCGGPPEKVSSGVDLKAILQRPLIVGASVSADTGAMSPGKKLALRFTAKENIRTKARSGAPGREVAKSLKGEDFKDRTIVIATDLFFWDSVLTPVDETEAALKGILVTVEALRIPLVLGNIPRLLPFGRQRSRDDLNKLIGDHCGKSAFCTVYDLAAIHEKLDDDGYLEHQSKRYRFSELLPDGLHLSEIGSEYLADRIAEIL